MMDYNQLLGNLTKDFSGLARVKIAVLGEIPTQHMVKATRSWGYEAGLDLDIFEGAFDKIDQEILDSSSVLYQFKPEFVFIFPSLDKWKERFYSCALSDKAGFSDRFLEQVRMFYEALSKRMPVKLVMANMPGFDDRVFGNYANKTRLSWLYQVRRINVGLMELSQQIPDLFINDIAALNETRGSKELWDVRNDINIHMPYSLDGISVIARNAVDIIQASRGHFKKCLILDLDNTLWGGVVADEGLENIQIGGLGIGKAFSDLQRWVKQLKERGILLAVCSKNDLPVAEEPFLKHPDMILRKEDFVVFMVNWDAKPDNIHLIAQKLNIGFDAMVFVDDSTFERQLVKSHCPGLTVVDMPEDPSEYLGFLQGLNLFETSSYVQEDRDRTQQYQEESSRQQARSLFINQDDFLQNLSMRAVIGTLDTFVVPRAAQLTQRSNQFNLRTVRYSIQDIQRLKDSEDHLHFTVSLKDKFGDYGLIGLVILKKMHPALFIDTWIMSCRVFQRNVEHLMLNEMANLARQNGFDLLVGEYCPTPKNGIVKGLYQQTGFVTDGSQWMLNVSSCKPLNHYITVV
ncbi:MAG: HAD family hydrolase [Candidatus Omnitrophica bacterium]|nr:HAD family hydrolase [Candidatus Omnitrophota bacterium]